MHAPATARHGKSRRLRSTGLRVMSLLAASGCALDANDGADPAKIIGGTPTTGFPAVGMVGVSTAAELCTGFLISPTIVLTAAHCISAPDAAYGFYTGLGQLTTVADVTAQTLASLPDVVKHDVLESRAYPLADLVSTPFRYDVAYVRLAQPITTAAPLGLGANPPAGDSCTAVGYGMVSLTTPTGLVKKTATETVVDVDAVDIDVRYGTGIAHRGDSGGPLLCQGEAVGVSSWIDDYATTTALRRYARLDGAVRAWIDGVVNPAPPGAYKAGDPFDYGLVVTRSPMVTTMLASLAYATSTAPRAVAVNALGLGYVSVQPSGTVADAQRAALEACYVIGGRTPCALLAVGGAFAIDSGALATSFSFTLAAPTALGDLPFAPASVRAAVATGYAALTGAKAVAVGLDGTTSIVPTTDATDTVQTQPEAERLALERCEMMSSTAPCTLFARGNTVVLDPAHLRWTPAIDYARTTVQPNPPGMTDANYAAHMVPYLAGVAQGFQGVTYIAWDGNGGNAWTTSAATSEQQARTFCEQHVSANGRCVRYALNRSVILTPHDLAAIQRRGLPYHCGAMPRLDCATHKQMGCTTSGSYYTTHAGGVALETCTF
jgi:hypothetical protein